MIDRNSFETPAKIRRVCGLDRAALYMVQTNEVDDSGNISEFNYDSGTPLPESVTSATLLLCDEDSEKTEEQLYPTRLLNLLV